MVLLTLSCLATNPAATGREPISEFVASLQKQGEYALAHQYLDHVSSSSLVTIAERDELGFHRGTLFLNQAEREARASQQQELAQRALEALREFCRRLPDHELAPSGYLRLADLELWQARQTTKSIGTDPAKRAEAMGQLQKAQESFRQAQERIKQRMQGLPRALDPKRDAVQFKQRRRWETEYLQTLLSQAIIELEMSDWAAESADRDSHLEQALSQFQEIANKYRLRLEAAAARLYIAQCYLRRHDPNQALGYLTELLDARSTNEGVIQLQTRALPLALDAWIKENPPKWTTALRYGENWLSTVGKKIPADHDAWHAQLLLAQAYHGQAQTLAGHDAQRMRREARRWAQRVSQTPNAFQTEARQLLGQLGVELSESTDAGSTELVWQEPQSAQEALQLARPWLTQLDELSVPIAKDPKPPELVEKWDTIRALCRRALQRATELAQDANTKQEARALLAFLELREGNAWEAAVLATHVLRAHPDTQSARDAGPIALSAWAQAQQHATPSAQPTLQKHLLEIAEFLAKNFAGQEIADRGAMIVAKVLTAQHRFDEADQWIARLPAQSAYRRDAQLFIGQALLDHYQKQPPAARIEAEYQRGIAALEAAWEELRSQPASVDSIRTALLMAAARQKSDPAGAEKLLRDPTHGPLTLWEQQSPLVLQQPQLAAATCQLALQGAVGQLKTNASPDNVKQCMTIVRQILSIPVETGHANDTRLALYASLAQEAGALLSRLNAQQQQELAHTLVEAFRPFVSDQQDPQHLAWVSAALHQLAGPLSTSQLPPTADATSSGGSNTAPSISAPLREVLELAVAADELILKPGSAANAPNPATDVPHMQAGQRLALAYRQLHQFEKSVQILGQQLRISPQFINLQVLAAETYQAWGDAGQPDHYAEAMQGAQPDSAGKPAIWGWATIARAASRSPQHLDIMLDAQLRLAQCRRGLARAKTGEERLTLLRAAKSNVVTTPKLVPAAAQEPWKSRFAELLKAIQHDLGEAGDPPTTSPTSHLEAR